MTVFWLKIIACVTMICDHIKYVFPTLNVEIMEFLGRMSFPLFSLLIVESYTHTRNMKKYIFRLVVLAIISQYPFMSFRSAYLSDRFMLDVIFTFLLGIAAMMVLDKKWNDLIKALLVALILFLGQEVNVDYSLYGVTMVILFFITRNNKVARNILITILVTVFYVMSYKYDLIHNMMVVCSYMGTLSSLFVINLYNGEEGKKIKYFYYIFYPTHLYFFYLLSLI